MRLSKKTILYLDATTTREDGFDANTLITHCQVIMTYIPQSSRHPLPSNHQSLLACRMS